MTERIKEVLFVLINFLVMTISVLLMAISFWAYNESIGLLGIIILIGIEPIVLYITDKYL